MRKDGLSQKAYVPLAEGDSYDPFVPANESPGEFTLKAVGLGILFGIIFGAANAYLGLRAGLTISTSIPEQANILPPILNTRSFSHWICSVAAGSAMHNFLSAAGVIG